MPSEKPEGIKDIINNVYSEQYMIRKKEFEDSIKKEKQRIFKDAVPTKSYGYWLKALENFKKNYEHQFKQFTPVPANKSILKEKSVSPAKPF